METILFALSGISLVMVGIFGILTKKNIIKILLELIMPNQLIKQ